MTTSNAPTPPLPLNSSKQAADELLLMDVVQGHGDPAAQQDFAQRLQQEPQLAAALAEETELAEQFQALQRQQHAAVPDLSFSALHTRIEQEQQQHWAQRWQTQWAAGGMSLAASVLLGFGLLGGLNGPGSDLNTGQFHTLTQGNDQAALPAGRYATIVFTTGLQATQLEALAQQYGFELYQELVDGKPTIVALSTDTTYQAVSQWYQNPAILFAEPLYDTRTR